MRIAASDSVITGNHCVRSSDCAGAAWPSKLGRSIVSSVPNSCESASASDRSAGQSSGGSGGIAAASAQTASGSANGRSRSASSAAVAIRSSGDFAIAASIAAASSGGQSGRSERTGSGVTAASAVSFWYSEPNRSVGYGSLPQTSRYSVAPSAYTSARASTDFGSAACSGAMKSTVPITAPDRVRSPSKAVSCSAWPESSGRMVASPRSQILTPP